MFLNLLIIEKKQKHQRNHEVVVNVQKFNLLFPMRNPLIRCLQSKRLCPKRILSFKKENYR